MSKSTNTFTEESKTRLLLFLWDLGGYENKVKKGDLMGRLKRNKEKSALYNPVFDDLEQLEAITRTKKGSSFLVSLTDRGVEILDKGLQSPEFEFGGNQVGSRVANALLKWIRQLDSTPRVTDKIQSLAEFKPVILDIFEKLDKGYNYGGLVPIWHLRQELGNKVDRTDFNELMMEMQAQEIFDLQSGEAKGATEQQKQDSITSEIRGLLFFAGLVS